MKNKIALVTGGMGDIGTAICHELTKEGCHVIASYNRNGDHERAKKWQIDQRKLGMDIDIYYADVSNFKSCAMMINIIEEKYGAIDILVNNAGTTRDVPFYKMELDQWQIVLKTNLDSIFNVTRNVINGMLERGYGRIINISSINGQKGQYGQSNYSASKAGIHGFTKSLSLEVAKKGITVNTISPGYIETKMVMAAPLEARERIIKQIPVGRFGKPDEVAQAVSYLASIHSGFITGSILAINGGQYLY